MSLAKVGTLVEKSFGGEERPDVNNRYHRYDKKLGGGAYKQVYRAFDTKTGVDVAWNTIEIDKMRSEAERAKMMREIEITEKLSHPNILRILNHWVNPRTNQLCFVTNLIQGGSLRSYLNDREVNLGRVKMWSREILSGLQFLHSLKPPIIHRDIKCDNIFVDAASGHITIGDLGLATMGHSQAIKKGLSAAGTPEFMAPEVFVEQYDEKVDIYSFGMALLEMITNKYPYSECNGAWAVYEKLKSRKYPDILNTIKQNSVRSFIQFCVEHDAYRRPSAAECLEHPFLYHADTVLDETPVISFISGYRRCSVIPEPQLATIPESKRPLSTDTTDSQTNNQFPNESESGKPANGAKQSKPPRVSGGKRSNKAPRVRKPSNTGELSSSTQPTASTAAQQPSSVSASVTSQPSSKHRSKKLKTKSESLRYIYDIRVRRADSSEPGGTLSIGMKINGKTGGHKISFKFGPNDTIEGIVDEICNGIEWVDSRRSAEMVATLEKEISAFKNAMAAPPKSLSAVDDNSVSDTVKPDRSMSQPTSKQPPKPLLPLTATDNAIFNPSPQHTQIAQPQTLTTVAPDIVPPNQMTSPRAMMIADEGFTGSVVGESGNAAVASAIVEAPSNRIVGPPLGEYPQPLTTATQPGSVHGISPSSNPNPNGNPAGNMATAMTYTIVSQDGTPVFYQHPVYYPMAHQQLYPITAPQPSLSQTIQMPMQQHTTPNNGMIAMQPPPAQQDEPTGPLKVLPPANNQYVPSLSGPPTSIPEAGPTAMYVNSQPIMLVHPMMMPGSVPPSVSGSRPPSRGSTPPLPGSVENPLITYAYADSVASDRPSINTANIERLPMQNNYSAPTTPVTSPPTERKTRTVSQPLAEPPIPLRRMSDLSDASHDTKKIGGVTSETVPKTIDENVPITPRSAVGGISASHQMDDDEDAVKDSETVLDEQTLEDCRCSAERCHAELKRLIALKKKLLKSKFKEETEKLKSTTASKLGKDHPSSTRDGRLLVHIREVEKAITQIKKLKESKRAIAAAKSASASASTATNTASNTAEMSTAVASTPPPLASTRLRDGNAFMSPGPPQTGTLEFPLQSAPSKNAIAVRKTNRVTSSAVEQLRAQYVAPLQLSSEELTAEEYDVCTDILQQTNQKIEEKRASLTADYQQFVDEQSQMLELKLQRCPNDSSQRDNACRSAWQLVTETKNRLENKFSEFVADRKKLLELSRQSPVVSANNSVKQDPPSEQPSPIAPNPNQSFSNMHSTPTPTPIPAQMTASADVENSVEYQREKERIEAEIGYRIKELQTKHDNEMAQLKRCLQQSKDGRLDRFRRELFEHKQLLSQPYSQIPPPLSREGSFISTTSTQPQQSVTKPPSPHLTQTAAPISQQPPASQPLRAYPQSQTFAQMTAAQTRAFPASKSFPHIVTMLPHQQPTIQYQFPTFVPSQPYYQPASTPVPPQPQKPSPSTNTAVATASTAPPPSATQPPQSNPSNAATSRAFSPPHQSQPYIVQQPYQQPIYHYYQPQTIANPSQRQPQPSQQSQQQTQQPNTQFITAVEGTPPYSQVMATTNGQSTPVPTQAQAQAQVQAQAQAQVQAQVEAVQAQVQMQAAQTQMAAAQQQYMAALQRSHGRSMTVPEVVYQPQPHFIPAQKARAMSMPDGHESVAIANNIIVNSNQSLQPIKHRLSTPLEEKPSNASAAPPLSQPPPPKQQLSATTTNQQTTHI